jgi:hypothetical protein
VFPFLDAFRRFSYDSEITLAINYSFLLSGHFDAFQNFSRIISIGFVSYGVQLLGVFLFFVPRALWPEKPIGTGHQLAENANYSFSNISATWYAEGWANFGFTGALLFSIFIGFLMAKLDKSVWSGKAGDFMKIFYMFLLGYIFFLLRGDLLSAFAYIIGTLVAISVPYYIVASSKH